MNILGIDSSPRSTGLVKFVLDESFEIVEIKRLGFLGYDVPKKKDFEPPKYKDIISYDNELDFYNRSLLMIEYVSEFIKDCEYAAIEDYAFGANGSLCEISEWCSLIKFQLIRNGTKIRLISPLQNKQFATGSGKAEKTDMFDSLIKEPLFLNFDISDLPKIPVYIRGKNKGKRNPKGCSPTSDIVDAAWLCYVLYDELRIRFGIKTLDWLEDFHKHVISHTTKKTKIPLYKQDFIFKTL